MSKHHVVWTVPSNWGLGGIIGVWYLSQMRWPVGFLSTPSFLIMRIIIWCNLYKPISLGVVGYGLQSLDAKDLAQFLSYITSEASTSIAQELGWGP